MFHMAAPNSSINNYQLHHSVNVEGAVLWGRWVFSLIAFCLLSDVLKSSVPWLDLFVLCFKLTMVCRDKKCH